MPMPATSNALSILFEVGSTCVGGAERVVLRIARYLREHRPTWTLDCVVLLDHGGLEADYQTTFNHVWAGPRKYKDSGHRIAELVHDLHYPVVHCIDAFHLTHGAAELCPEAAFIQNVFPNVEKSPFAPERQWLEDQNSPYAALVTEFKANLHRLPVPRRAPGARLVIPNGIDTSFWTPGTAGDRQGRRDGRGDAPETPRDIDVLWVARTDPEKGIELALELANRLCALGYTFCMVTSEPDGPQQQIHELAAIWHGGENSGQGDAVADQQISHDTANGTVGTWGTDEQQWKRRAMKKGGVGHFIPMSRLSPSELRDVYRRSRVFLQTSSVEGMPATPLEATCCGCWPVCSYIDGIAEVFAGRPALTVDPPLTVDNFLAAMVPILHSPPARYRRMSTETSWVIRSHYSNEKMCSSYLKLYEELAAAAGGPVWRDAA